MANRQRESKIEERFRDRVKAMGGRALKLTRLPGYPDRIVLLPGGRVSFVELKRPKGGVLALHQDIAHSILREMGFEVEVVSTYTEIDDWIRRHLG